MDAGTVSGMCLLVALGGNRYGAEAGGLCIFSPKHWGDVVTICDGAGENTILMNNF